MLGKGKVRGKAKIIFCKYLLEVYWTISIRLGLRVRV